METRTELIHLQRTMVVVEGVARSMNPKMNIWEDARPIVEAYIKDSIGPKAVLQDLVKTAVVLSRYGSRLPAIAEAAIIRQSEPTHDQGNPSPLRPIAWMLAGGALTAVAIWIGHSL
jgi:ubiquinone biosynthesis protein